MATLKTRIGGLWVPTSNLAKDKYGIIESVRDQVSYVETPSDVGGGATVTQAANSAPQAAPSQTVSTELQAPAVGQFLTGSASGTSFTITRPSGTVAGDVLFLLMTTAIAEVTAPTITGWTKLSGFDGTTVGKFALYQRTADLTATDTPTVSLVSGVSRIIFWAVTPVRGMTSVDVAATFTQLASSTALTGPSVTTISAASLVIEIMSGNNSIYCTALSGSQFSGVITNVQAYLAYKWMSVAGVSGAPTWTMNPTAPGGVYALAVK